MSRNEDVLDVFPVRSANAFSTLLCEGWRLRAYETGTAPRGATLGQVADWWKDHPKPRQTMLGIPNHGRKSLDEALAVMVSRGGS